tara:strand:- start:397 stop:825 length:429 start_codon:yes stop_codon:yes gene_type:complete
MTKTGRPTIYSEELINQILNDLAHGVSIKKALSNHGVWWESFRQWLNNPDYPDLRKRYTEAKADGIEWMMAETTELSEKALAESKEENKAGRTNRDYVNMMRHHINLQTFRAGKLAPRVYGNKDQLEISGVDGGEIKVSFEK